MTANLYWIVYFSEKYKIVILLYYNLQFLSSDDVILDFYY